mmetsp:Transcript_27944/g.82857  ORF Transcript_27944/g.82857 Transcript_27944/m.82857 type:complete len:345 (+) Transcript_27944:2403-3437(+)
MCVCMPELFNHQRGVAVPTCVLGRLGCTNLSRCARIHTHTKKLRPSASVRRETALLVAVSIAAVAGCGRLDSCKHARTERLQVEIFHVLLQRVAPDQVVKDLHLVCRDLVNNVRERRLVAGDAVDQLLEDVGTGAALAKDVARVVLDQQRAVLLEAHGVPHMRVPKHARDRRHDVVLIGDTPAVRHERVELFDKLDVAHTRRAVRVHGDALRLFDRALALCEVVCAQRGQRASERVTRDQHLPLAVVARARDCVQQLHHGLADAVVRKQEARVHLELICRLKRRLDEPLHQRRALVIVDALRVERCGHKVEVGRQVLPLDLLRATKCYHGHLAGLVRIQPHLCV